MGDGVDLGVAAHPLLCGVGKELGVLSRRGEGVGVPGAAVSQTLPAFTFRLAFLPAVDFRVWANRNRYVFRSISLEALSLHLVRLAIRLFNF